MRFVDEQGVLGRQLDIGEMRPRRKLKTSVSNLELIHIVLWN